jgi:hypothetical protein
MTIEKRPDGTTRGGQEPPDELQDRPEQQQTYNDVVRGRDAEVDELDEDFVPGPDNTATPISANDPDERAAREAAAVVRRQQRSNR